MTSPLRPPGLPREPGGPFKQIPVPFHADGYALNGVLHLPAGPATALVVGAHGLFAASNSPKQIALAERCNRLGMAFFRFDHRGCGDSQGDFREVTSLEGRARDIAAAVAAAGSRLPGDCRLGLFGSSLGGAASIAAARRVPVAAMVTVAAPVHSRTIDPGKVRPADLGGNPRRVDPQRLVFDLRDQLTHLSHILVFHGDADEVVPFENARSIVSAAADPKKLVCFSGGDHRMSAASDQVMFEETAGRWFGRHLLGPGDGR
jgi:alpha-beta hydrolase superfamily lysophospholipase